MLVWYMPVMSAEREGEQIEPVTKARSKSIPLLASRSTFGVWIT